MTSIEMTIIDNTKSYSAFSIEGKGLESIQDGTESIDNKGYHSIEKPNIALIESTTRAALIEQSGVALVRVHERSNGEVLVTDIPENKGLSDEEKEKIKAETSWSDDIIDNIQNMKQYEILKNAGLIETEINGRKCLIKENIDLEYTDDDGISNRDRIVRGLAPLDIKTGKPLELHHLGQKTDSPLVELTAEEHRTGEYENGKKNHTLWHDNTRESEVHAVGNSWTQERTEHWKTRSSNV